MLLTTTMNTTLEALRLRRPARQPSPNSGLAPEDNMPRSTTPTPENPDGSPQRRSGMLTIQVTSAEGLAVPTGTSVSPAVQAALSSAEAKAAASVSPSSVAQQRLASRSKRESVHRAQCWWLPYLVMEFDVNQVLIIPLGGSLATPVYMYQTHL